ncbi:hypothetical protein D3C73_1519050 [compost metagenome]
MKLCQGDDVFRLSGQLDVRVPADHASGRAGGVEEDALERFAVPPNGSVAAIGGDQFGIQTQAFEVFPHPHQALGFKVHRDHTGQCRFGF